MLATALIFIVYATLAQHRACVLSQYVPKLAPPYGGDGGVYGSPSSDYYPYGSPSSDYYPTTSVIFKPVWLPEYPASHELLYPRRHESRSSSSRGGSDCDDCRRVTLSCWNSPEPGCFRPRIKYLKGHCKEAVVSCDSYGENVLLVTNSGDILSEGVGISKFIKCKGHRWTARNVYGDPVTFRGLHCLQRAPRRYK